MPKFKFVIRSLLLIGAVACPSALYGAMAVAGPNCAEFFSNPDGSWSPTHPIVVEGPSSQTPIMPSDKFRLGMPGLAGGIAASLNHHCRYERAPSTLHGIPKRP